MSAQNLCISVRKSWIRPARAVSSPCSLTLLKAPESSLPRGKREVSRSEGAGVGGVACRHARRGELKLTLLLKGPAQRRCS